jgi:HEPN domain-containing protein
LDDQFISLKGYLNLSDQSYLLQQNARDADAVTHPHNSQRHQRFIPFSEGYNTTMIDIGKQIIYWRNSSEEDWQVASELIKAGRTRHGLFLAQLAIEKILKAHVCRQTNDIAPRIHNLVRLAELASIVLTSRQLDILADMNKFNIEGRYPNIASLAPSQAEAQIAMGQAEEIYQWLMSRLP